ncbi:MAG: VCBS repeat-containing protein [Phycisphaerales bacterium]|nr:VCBS repeat-containing protein [Phycisphaerales bacterium]
MRTITPAVILSSCLCVCAHADGPLVFAQPVYDEMPAGIGPTMLRARDLDADGILDLVVPARSVDGISVVLRGVGDGHFLPWQSLTVGGFSDWAELEDFDGDGLVDILFGVRGDPSQLALFKGDKAGTFSDTSIRVELGRDNSGLASGDFDGDGDRDVAATNYLGASVDILLNVGDGHFTRAARLDVARWSGSIAFPRQIEPCDVDGDGDLDLLGVLTGSGRLILLRSNGDGTFEKSREWQVPQIGEERPGFATIALADLDADGDIDVLGTALLLAPAQKSIAFMNDGSGGFAQRIVLEGTPIGYAFSVCLGDFDHDGDLDAAQGAALPGLIVPMRNIGGSTSPQFVVEQFLGIGQLPRYLIAIDVDGDCDLDIVGCDSPVRAVFTAINLTPQMDGCTPRLLAAPTVALKTNAEKLQSITPTPTFDCNEDGAKTASDLVLELHAKERR